MKYNTIYFLFIFFSFLTFSCNEQRIYEKNTDIEEEWGKEDTLVYEFDIQDSVSLYNLYYNVRYSNSYPFYNLFTRYWLYDSTGNMIKNTIIPEDMYLFDIKTGEPNGSGLGSLYDQRINFLKNYKFATAGKYSLKVVQYMREEPLPGIASFGIRVEKAEVASK